MVNDKQIAREEIYCRHYKGYSFRLVARVLLYTHPTDRIAHTAAFVTLIVEHWLERAIAQWVHSEVLILRPHRRDDYTTRSRGAL